MVDGPEGCPAVAGLVPEHADEPEQVVVGVGADRGLLVQALLVAGYQVDVINPLAVSRYRDHHTTSRAKSDPADAMVLADHHKHLGIARDAELAEVAKVRARGPQDLVCTGSAR